MQWGLGSPVALTMKLSMMLKTWNLLKFAISESFKKKKKAPQALSFSVSGSRSLLLLNNYDAETCFIL